VLHAIGQLFTLNLWKTDLVNASRNLIARQKLGGQARKSGTDMTGIPRPSPYEKTDISMENDSQITAST